MGSAGRAARRDLDARRVQAGEDTKTLGYQKSLDRYQDAIQRRDQRGALGMQGREAAGQFTTGVSDFRRNTEGTPQQIGRLQQLIREQALPEQQRAMRQGRVSLQQKGVRGPEAALMMQRQSSAMQTDLANRAEQVALQQALQDRTARQKFARDRAMGAQAKSFQQGLRADQVKVGDEPISPEQAQRIEANQKQAAIQKQAVIQQQTARIRRDALNKEAIQKQIAREEERKAEKRRIQEGLGFFGNRTTKLQEKHRNGDFLRDL